MRRESLAAFALAAVASAAGAQGGYTTEKFPELGLELPRPRDYSAVPVQPDDPWTVLFFVEKEAFREADRKRYRPELQVLWIDRPTEQEQPPPEELPPPLPEGDGGEVPGEGAEEAPPPPPVDFPTWQEQVDSRWRVERRTELDARDGSAVTEYELSLSVSGHRFRRWACAFDDGRRTVALMGTALLEDFEDQADIWRHMARKLELTEPRVELDKEVERYYARRAFSNVEYRKRVRAKLVRGWKAEDTDNYIVVYSTKDEPLIRLVKSELEALREAYVELFPPVRPVEAVSTVRVCKDEAEYLKYGGPRGTGGYWNSRTEELVFYDYENVDGKAGTGKADTRIALYHEAFHQYIHYAVGELPPHTWFNEGTGDYFSGALVKGGKVKKIDVNPWRIDLVQYALTVGGRYRPIPFAEILGYEKKEFYDPSRRSVCYAQAWSMVYFLRTAKEVRKRPEWAGILDRYFESLKREYASELAALGESPAPEAKDEAGKRAREKALEVAFADIDLQELEDVWKEYTLSLKGTR